MEFKGMPIIGGAAERARLIAKDALRMGARAVGGAIEGALYDPAQIEKAEFDDIVRWIPAWEIDHMEAVASGEAMTRIPQDIQEHARAAAQNYAEHYARFHDRRNADKREEYALKLSVALLVGNTSVETVQMDPIHAEAWRADVRSVVTRATEPLPIRDTMLPHLITT